MVILNGNRLGAEVGTNIVLTISVLLVWLNTGKAVGRSQQPALLFMVIHLFAASFQPKELTGKTVMSTFFIALVFVKLLLRG
ncbi:hypothetical protein [Sporosarcina sp. FSL K6-1508]|uniref:hypothetical protein n=1 Tax=Sporosarcina sp. FSL K6-1508 TaxID=2921553 RepID=UPI0030FAC8A0